MDEKTRLIRLANGMEVSEEEKRKLRKMLAGSVLDVSTLSEMFGKSSGAFGLARHIAHRYDHRGR